MLDRVQFRERPETNFAVEIARLRDWVDGWEALDEGEQEVALLARNGLTSVEISVALGQGEDETESIFETACEKLGIHSHNRDLLRVVVSAFEF